jgi:hypothetical protein
LNMTTTHTPRRLQCISLSIRDGWGLTRGKEPYRLCHRTNQL